MWKNKLEQNNNREIILSRGNRNIQATHKTTLEFTKDIHLSKKGNCIVVVAADKSVNDFSDGFKKKLKKNNSKLTIIIEVDGVSDKIIAEGSPNLPLTNFNDIVIRKSDYICNRTLAINADKAACDLSLNLVEKLKDPKNIVKITLLIN